MFGFLVRYRVRLEPTAAAVHQRLGLDLACQFERGLFAAVSKVCEHPGELRVGCIRFKHTNVPVKSVVTWCRFCMCYKWMNILATPNSR